MRGPDWLLFMILLALALATGANAQDPPAATPAAAKRFRVLVFTKTTGFRHDSISDGISLVQGLGAANGFRVDVSENAAVFTPQGLRTYRTVIFLNTTGEIL